MISVMRKNKFLLLALLSFMTLPIISASVEGADDEQYAEITFEKTTHDFGLFDLPHGDQTCWFVFKNTGNKELIITSASASCGCTVPEYPKTAVLPGMKDSIKVTYNGSTRRVGTFRKTISVVTNAKINSSYLYITGEMVEKLVEDRVAKKEEK